MSLLPALTDAEIIAKYRERMGVSTVAVPGGANITLGPDSPLRTPKSAAAKNVRHPATRSKSSQEEHDIQCDFFDWANDETNLLAVPELALCFAVPNGGKRSIGVAAKLKGEGVKPGVPDVWLPVPRKGFHGLVIEFKKPGGALAPSQADWIAALTKQGYKVVIHHTFEGARDDVLRYLTD